MKSWIFMVIRQTKLHCYLLALDGNARGCFLLSRQRRFARIARSDCSLPVAEMQGFTRRGACVFGAKSRCNFSVKLRICCVFTPPRTFLFCLRFTIHFPMPVWKRLHVVCP